MSMFCGVGAFNTGTGTTPITVTTTDRATAATFQPKAIIFWWSGRTESTDAVGGEDIFRGIGFAANTTNGGGSRNYGVGTNADDANAIADSNSWQQITDAIMVRSLAQGAIGTARVTAWNATGMTVTPSLAFTLDRRIHYVALGGTDITNVALESVTSPTTVTTQDITGPGFLPDCAFVLSHGAVAGTESARAIMSFGAATSTANQFVWSGGSEGISVAAADTQAYCLSGEVYARPPNTMANALDSRAAISAFISTGVTMNFIANVTPAADVLYLCLKGGQYLVGNLLTSVTLDADVVETGFGFQPIGALFISHCRAASTVDTPTSDDEWSMGAFAGTSTFDRGAQGTTDDDAAATMICGTAVEHDNVYVSLTQVDATAIDGLMDIQSVESNGFTMNMDDGDGVAAFVGYVAFGVPSAGGGPTPFFPIKHYQQAVNRAATY